MWVVVSMVSSLKTANAMRQCLEDEGILVKLKNLSVKARSGADTYEILVLKSEADAAREILMEKGY